MVGENARELSLQNTHGSLDLLVPAATARGWRFERLQSGEGARFTLPSGAVLDWPACTPVRKSQIPILLSGAMTLRSVKTVPPARAAEIPLPICVKPDIGSLGFGFRCISESVELQEILQLLEDQWVVQPFVQAAEFRVSLCRDGAFAAAQLLERQGASSRWHDATSQLPLTWLPDLHALLRNLAVPVIGVDILQDREGEAFVIDVNTAPDIRVHMVTATPRSLAASILDSWYRLAAPPSDAS